MSWNTEEIPKYIPNHLISRIHFDESGFWLIFEFDTDRKQHKIREELIVCITGVDNTTMGILGIPRRIDLTDEWIDGQGIIVDDTGTYYLATEDGNPISIEI